MKRDVSSLNDYAQTMEAFSQWCNEHGINFRRTLAAFAMAMMGRPPAQPAPHVPADRRDGRGKPCPVVITHVSGEQHSFATQTEAAAFLGVRQTRISIAAHRSVTVRGWRVSRGEP